MSQINIRLKNRYFKARLAKGGPWVPMKLWWGISNDPLTGKKLDRSPTPRFKIAHADLPVDIGDRAYDWVMNKGEPMLIWDGARDRSGEISPRQIPIDEYQFLMKAKGHGSSPLRRVDMSKIKPVV